MFREFSQTHLLPLSLFFFFLKFCVHLSYSPFLLYYLCWSMWVSEVSGMVSAQGRGWDEPSLKKISSFFRQQRDFPAQ